MYRICTHLNELDECKPSWKDFVNLIQELLTDLTVTEYDMVLNT